MQMRPRMWRALTTAVKAPCTYWITPPNSSIHHSDFNILACNCVVVKNPRLWLGHRPLHAAAVIKNRGLP